MGWLLWVLAWYGFASAVSFALFAIDKQAARKGRRRVPEATLHAFSAIGGWPGAIGAMLVVRHKNRKAGFVLVTGAIAIAHVGVALLVWWLS